MRVPARMSALAALGARRDAAVRAAGAVCAVSLAVAAAHALNLSDTWWAAITAFVVPDASLRGSLTRGVLRILGTLCGAALGVLLGTAFQLDGALFVVLIGVATWAGLYLAHTQRFSYAWLLFIITFVMVLCEAWTARGELVHFALERCANVAVGIVASLVVEGAFALALRRPHAPAKAGAASAATRRAAALHALQGAIAVALFALLLTWHQLQPLAQAMVTALAVLIVPLGVDAQEAHPHVRQRMVLRLGGCAVAVLLALALLPLLEGRAIACQLALALGVAAGGWVQHRVPAWRYAAIQFSVAFIMVFVQDRGWTVHPEAALARLAGIVVGVVLMLVVMSIWAWLARGLRRRGVP